VGFLEEEAVHTYTKFLKSIDEGLLQDWKTTKAPNVAIEYYGLDPKATIRDMIL
jgi:hypothetical protein